MKRGRICERRIWVIFVFWRGGGKDGMCALGRGEEI